MRGVDEGWVDGVGTWYDLEQLDSGTRPYILGCGMSAFEGNSVVRGKAVDR